MMTYKELKDSGVRVPALREDFYLDPLDLEEAQALIGFKLDENDL